MRSNPRQVKLIILVAATHIYNPSKPPFKCASLLFVAAVRQNIQVCYALTLIATLTKGGLVVALGATLLTQEGHKGLKGLKRQKGCRGHWGWWVQWVQLVLVGSSGF